MKDNLSTEFRIAELIAKKSKEKLSATEEQELKSADLDSEFVDHLLSTAGVNYLERNQIRETMHQKQGWVRVKKEISKGTTRKLIVRWSAVAAILLLAIGGTFMVSKIGNPDTAEKMVVTLPDQAFLVTGSGETYKLNDQIDSTTNVRFGNTIRLIRNPEKLLADDLVRYDTLVVPRGSSFNFELMDGTKVWVNSNSKLIFPSRFEGNSRQVKLIGEAYFDVAHDTAHPFLIDVAQTQVRVIGTAFNLKAYRKERGFTATVVEGKVQVTNPTWKTKELLTRDEQLHLDCLDGQTERKIVNTDIYTSWVRGRLVFDEENLESIMNRIEELYPVRIVFKNHKARMIKFSGDIARYPNVNQVFEMLSITGTVNITMKDQVAYIE